MSAAVERLLRVARGEIGTTEQPPGSNVTRYGKAIGCDGQPWCMAFVQWCFSEAGMALPYRTASCSALLDWYRKNRPACVTEVPAPGDVAIYTFGHTGIVESVGAGSVTAIEGNTSPGRAGSQDNGGGVYRRTRGTGLVRAYIRPFMGAENIGREDESMTGEQIYQALQAYLAAQPVPDWAKEELAGAVEAGVTDGTDPTQLVPRYQAAIMAYRAGRR